MLVACNPFQYFRIYDTQHTKMHEHANRTDLAPHVYAIAEAAFRGVRSHRCCVDFYARIAAISRPATYPRALLLFHHSNR